MNVRHRGKLRTDGSADEAGPPSGFDGIGAGQGTARQELFDLLNFRRGEAASIQDLSVELRLVRKGEALFEQGGPAGSLHFVRSGTFKVCQVDSEGYEQVLRFPIRGEMMGYDSIEGEQHPWGATALEASTVLSVGHADVTRARRDCAAFDQVIQGMLSRQLMQVADVAELMAAVAAEVRVARFLCQLSKRIRFNGESGSRLLLRMSRRDIASYLGLAIETVSRCFSLLAVLGYVRVERKEVEILSLAGLRVAARSTRRATEPIVAARDDPVARRSTHRAADGNPPPVSTWHWNAADDDQATDTCPRTS